MITPFLLVLACFLSAALASFIVWRAFRSKAKEKVEQHESDRRKLEFLTYLTHELRSPITLINTPLQKLVENSYDPDTDNELRTMQKNAAKIVSILDKTLDVDRIDSDGSEMRFREINLVKYIYNLLSVFKYQAAQRDIEIALHSNKDRIVAWIDRNRFDEVLMHLISKAVKLSPSGGKVVIEVANDDKTALIDIGVPGSSIPKERIPHLFDLFLRSDSGSISGTNMEFYLIKEIVNHHKGTVTAANHSDGNGSSVTIKLPLGNSHIPKNRLTSRENILKEAWGGIDTVENTDDSDSGYTAVSGRKYSVIAIDESPDICAYLRTLLSPRFNITTYTNPTEGCNSVIADLPDLVIAEIMMSEVDGITLVRRIKGNPNTAHIPVLLLTALPGEEVRVQGLHTGADAIISKPFNEEELILSCNNLIKSRSRLASHIKDMQITKDMLQPVELQSNNDALMQKVLEVINERISNPGLNVEMLAEAIGISRGHLHRKIKEITGSSPGEYIRTIRLNQAAQLLKGEKKNISQIAYSVGYSNPSVFSTAFKSFFGISAKDYQKRYGNTELAEPAQQIPQDSEKERKPDQDQTISQ
jgi:AraC-like DNA-binding protein